MKNSFYGPVTSGVYDITVMFRNWEKAGVGGGEETEGECGIHTQSCALLPRVFQLSSSHEFWNLEFVNKTQDFTDSCGKNFSSGNCQTLASK
jgi:hypothetical protein